MDDWGLIEEFVGKGSQGAFEALVGRYLGLVYGVARRQVGEHQGAEDVTQAVFALLAKKAAKLNRRAALAGWLFQTTVYAAANVKKGERRRRFHEMALARLRWRELEVGEEGGREARMRALDEGLVRLRRREREVILLRYYREMSVAEVAGNLRITEAAAKKRVERAVGKLRVVIGVKGVAAPMAVIAGGLGFAGAKSGEAVAAGALMSAKGEAGTETVGIIMKGALKMMYVAKLKVAALVMAGAIVLGGAGVATVRHLAASEPQEALLPPKEVVTEVEYDQRRGSLAKYAMNLREEAEGFRRMHIITTHEEFVAALERVSRMDGQIDQADAKVAEAGQAQNVVKNAADSGGKVEVAAQEAARDAVRSAQSAAMDLRKRRDAMQQDFQLKKGDYLAYLRLDRKATAAETALEEMELRHIMGQDGK